MKWYRANNGRIDVPIVEYIEELIKLERERGYNVSVAIGTDAQKRGKRHKFVTVIAVITEGKGGKIVYTTDYDKSKLSMNRY